MLRIILIGFFIILCFGLKAANPDSLIFKNGNFMVGEIKSMDKGVLIFETDFSDADFKIEWKGISEIFSENFFLISVTDGYRYNGSFYSIDTSGTILITEEAGLAQTKLDDIVYIKSLDKDFWSRVSASIDVGLSVTKANNLHQFDTRANIGYLADRWSLNGTVSSLLSNQDDVDPTKRTDGSGTYTMFLPKDWFIPASLSFLSNTEQKLDVRLSGKFGIGKYVIHTNQSYLGFSTGLSYSNEKYSNEAEYRKNWEAYLGTELNLYDIGDLSLLTKVIIYQGLTDIQRFRCDFNFDLKYDLPKDFYIKIGTTLNYDNQPAEGASEADYVIQTGLGWEL
ncbi:MAG: DUF481 domain-containing protein [Bacteroidales bacterium]|nr:DUF481 domain-containing protein [Bacteroidales bacterium]